MGGLSDKTKNELRKFVAENNRQAFGLLTDAERYEFYKKYIEYKSERESEPEDDGIGVFKGLKSALTLILCSFGLWQICELVVNVIEWAVGR